MTAVVPQAAGPAPDSGAATAAPWAVRRLVSVLASLLVVLGAVDWRRGDYFSGSVDPVVLAKAVVSLLGLLLAFGLATSAPRRRLGTGSLWCLGLVLGSSLWGALTAGHLLPSAVVTGRVVVLGATVFFLLRAAPGLVVVRRLCWSCGAVALVAALTGLSGATSGRLAGGLPAMDPNALALLAGVALVVLAWRTVLGEASWPIATGALFFLAVLWLTGSRTALLMVLVGIAVMALQVRRPRVGLVVGALVLVAIGTVAAVTTGALTGFAERDGAGTSTLGSRFIAWRAAFTLIDSGWRAVFGGGMSIKFIPVTGQYWATQPLDSSWASLLVQTGALGLLVAAGWVCWAARGALRAPRPHRVLLLGLGVFLVGRSLLESGLFDASPAFLLFLSASLLGEGASWQRLSAEAAAGDGVPLEASAS